MKPDQPHPVYGARLAQWRRCRDAFSGSDAVKARRTEYLPKLDGQSESEYDDYLKRAVFLNATRRTVAGLLGAVFRKLPNITGMRDENWIEDVTLTDEPMESFARRVFMELLLVGRYGILVDLPAEESGEVRPYLAGYRAEDILNWSFLYSGGTQVLTRVAVRETEWGQDGKPDHRIRELTLDGGRYLQRVYQHGDHGWVVQSELAPNRQGIALDFIPFVFCHTQGIGVEVDDPPMLDLVDMNLAHFRASADLEHARHWVALPTPYVIAENLPEGTEFKVGSSKAWHLDDRNAKVGILEVSGAGIGHLENGVREKGAAMAILGARLLEQPKAAVEAADTHRIRMAGEQSILLSLARACEMTLAKVAGFSQWWMGGEFDTVEVELNHDFVSAKLTPQELAAYSQELILGHISYPTYYRLLQEGEIARPGVDWETELALAELQKPDLPTIP